MTVRSWHGKPITDMTREELLAALDLVMSIEAERRELDRRIDEFNILLMRSKH